MLGIRIVIGTNGDDQVSHEAQETPKIITSAVAQEAANDQNSENKDDGLEGLKGQAHIPPDTPPDENNHWGDKHHRLNAGSDNVEQCKVHPVVRGVANSCHMLGRLFDDWHENQTDECILNMTLLDNKVDLVYEQVGDTADAADRNNESEEAFA